ncbi:hypothetical protein [Blautia sp. LMAG:36]|nr:hypothetical protein [Blautia sp. LMAG:36]
MGGGTSQDESYEKIMDIYIESSVAAEDRIRMHQMMDLRRYANVLQGFPS